MALEFLTQGASPSSNSNTAAQTTLPDWYNAYIQGIAGKATDIAKNPFQNYPGQRIADFNDTQRQAFDAVRSNVGSYLPALTSAKDILTDAAPQVQGALSAIPGFGSAATNAVAGPAQAWTDPGTVAKYMSPYTASVVDEIGRLGNRNLMENILPQVQSNFVGSGQFGSTRNADILGRAIRDAQTDITGQQSLALQNGYTGAASIFGADANRAQTQAQLQANTNLGAGNLNLGAANAGTSAATGLGGALGVLGQTQQQLGLNDATALGAVGGQQQQLEQTGYNTAYQNFLDQQNWDWSQLGKVQSAVQGAQLPVGQTQSTSQATTTAGTSPLAWLSALGGLYNAFNP